jgi:hypothetical protein
MEGNFFRIESPRRKKTEFDEKEIYKRLMKGAMEPLNETERALEQACERQLKKLREEKRNKLFKDENCSCKEMEFDKDELYKRIVKEDSNPSEKMPESLDDLVNKGLCELERESNLEKSDNKKERELEQLNKEREKIERIRQEKERLNKEKEKELDVLNKSREEIKRIKLEREEIIKEKIAESQILQNEKEEIERIKGEKKALKIEKNVNEVLEYVNEAFTNLETSNKQKLEKWDKEAEKTLKELLQTEDRSYKQLEQKLEDPVSLKDLNAAEEPSDARLLEQSNEFENELEIKLPEEKPPKLPTLSSEDLDQFQKFVDKIKPGKKQQFFKFMLKEIADNKFTSYNHIAQSLGVVSSTAFYWMQAAREDNRLSKFVQVYEILQENFRGKIPKEKISTIIKQYQNGASLKNLAKEYDTWWTSIRYHLLKRHIQMHKKSIWNTTEIKEVKDFTPALAKFIAFIITDGSIQPRFVAVFNTSYSFIEEFKKIAKLTFGIEKFYERVRNEIKNQKKIYICEIKSVELVRTLRNYINKSDYQKASLPHKMFNLSEKDIGEVLRIAFSADGYVGLRPYKDSRSDRWGISKEISLACSSRSLKKQWKKLIESLDINCRITGPSIIITGMENIIKFKEKIDFLDGILIKKNTFWEGYTRKEVLGAMIESYERIIRGFPSKEDALKYLKSFFKR